MNWSLFPSGNSLAAQACGHAWQRAGWRVGVLIDADQPDVKCDLLIREETYRGTPAAFNRLIAAIGDTDWSVAACVNDDMYPLSCTSAQAAEAIHCGFVGTDGIIQPTGCWMASMQWCAPSPLIGRDYIRRVGMVWDEGFYHTHCDQILMDLAIREGKFRQDETLKIEHRHKSLGYVDTLPPEKRAKNNARHAADAKLYEERRVLIG